MSSEDRVFEKNSLNTIGHLKDRGRYDVDTIAAIVKEVKVLHVSYVDDEGLPQCVPMLSAWEEDESGQIYVYFHGWRGRIWKALSEPGVPICATGTIVDGYVLALRTFSHSMNYRSAVLHGVTFPIPEDDSATRKKAFELIVNAAIPGRWDNARHPDDVEDTTTGLFRMKVETASAKVRTGPPKDAPKDTDNPAVRDHIWSGVVPVRIVASDPIPAPYNTVKVVPDHVTALKNKYT